MVRRNVAEMKCFCGKKYVAIVPGQSLGYPYGSFAVCEEHNPYEKPIYHQDGTITLMLKARSQYGKKEKVMGREIKFRAWDKKYEIGSDGSVWSLDYNHTGQRKRLRQYLDQDGYPYVFLQNNGKRTKLVIHRAVAKLFLPFPRPPFPTPLQVNHKNGKRADNRLENLEWCTSRENTIHGFKMGRKISQKQVEAMRKGTVLFNHKRWHKGKACKCAI